MEKGRRDPAAFFLSRKEMRVLRNKFFYFLRESRILRQKMKRESSHNSKRERESSQESKRECPALLQKIIQMIQRKEARNLTCEICRREVFGGEYFCDACEKKLTRIQVCCPKCGRKGNEEGYCLECKAQLPVFDRARSVFTHEGEAARLVVRYKRGEKFLQAALTEAMRPLLSQFPDADALAFIPMTKRAERERGYNQSFLLAKGLAGSSGLALITDLEKTRETDAQKFLGRKEREKNLEGCFRVTRRESVSGRNIVIIDDTLTTGSTTGELSRVLKKAGAGKVYVLTVTSVEYKARGSKDSKSFGAEEDFRS